MQNRKIRIINNRPSLRDVVSHSFLFQYFGWLCPSCVNILPMYMLLCEYVCGCDDDNDDDSVSRGYGGIRFYARARNN